MRAIPHLGPLIRQRREAAGLSRSSLAALSGLSPSTVKNLESGRHLPTRSTLGLLAAVQDLQLDLPSLLHPDAPPTAPDGLPLNCWLAPGFDPIKMLRDLVHQLAGFGGQIEQSFLYLDPMSAACWCAIADQEDSSSAQRSMPIDRAATAIAIAAPNAHLDLLGLGCGDAKHEARLLQHLLDQKKPSPTDPRLGPSDSRLSQAPLRLFLLAISKPMLSHVFKPAQDPLARCPSVTVCAFQGNFHHLPQYPLLLAH